DATAVVVSLQGPVTATATTGSSGTVTMTATGGAATCVSTGVDPTAACGAAAARAPQVGGVPVTGSTPGAASTGGAHVTTLDGPSVHLQVRSRDSVDVRVCLEGRCPSTTAVGVSQTVGVPQITMVDLARPGTAAPAARSAGSVPPAPVPSTAAPSPGPGLTAPTLSSAVRTAPAAQRLPRPSAGLGPLVTVGLLVTVVLVGTGLLGAVVRSARRRRVGRTP
ncbi:MAG: hypothetical protein ACYCYA_04565, partial [Actinomycetes bacterium]